MVEKCLERKVLDWRYAKVVLDVVDSLEYKNLNLQVIEMLKQYDLEANKNYAIVIVPSDVFKGIPLPRLTFKEDNPFGVVPGCRFGLEGISYVLSQIKPKQTNN